MWAMRYEPKLAQKAAAAKAIRLCVALGRSRTTAAGQVASGDRQVSNRETLEVPKEGIKCKVSFHLLASKGKTNPGHFRHDTCSGVCLCYAGSGPRRIRG